MQRLCDFIDAGGIGDPSEHIYLLGNPAFFRRAGWDVIGKRQLPDSDAVLMIGFPHAPLENWIDGLDGLRRILGQIGRMRREFVVVLGKHYFEVGDAFAEALPGNVRAVFSCNVNTADPRIRYLPLGRDFRARKEAREVAPARERNMLCYANFSVDTHEVRAELRRRLPALGHVTMEHMGAFLDYPMSHAAFFERLRRAKFALCPRGAGIETFRIWDCLYLGVIPVVVDEAVFCRQLRGLPVLLLQSWDELFALPSERLEAIWEEMLGQRFDFSMLQLSRHLLEVYGTFVTETRMAA